MCILGLSKGDKQHILRTHNKYRGEVETYGQPEPSNMLEMVTKRVILWNFRPYLQLAPSFIDYGYTWSHFSLFFSM